MDKKKSKNTACIDRDGNLSVNGTYNFKGSMLKLIEILENAIDEYGEDTECELEVFGRFPHSYNSHLLITNKKLVV